MTQWQIRIPRSPALDLHIVGLDGIGDHRVVAAAPASAADCHWWSSEPELTVLREFWLPCGVRFSSVRDGACVLLWWEEAGEGGISPSTFATEEEEGWGRVRKVTLRDLCQGEASSSSTSSTGKGVDSITFMIYSPTCFWIAWTGHLITLTSSSQIIKN